MAVGIDIGSNSLRTVAIDCKSLKKQKEYEKVVRTAEALAQEGIISKKAIERIIEALNEVKNSFELLRYKAVATAAFRKARNTKEVLQEIEGETGIKIEVISAQEEAFYSLKGVEYGLKLKDIGTQKFLMVDIGGGSTEVILKHKDEFVFESFPIGILTTIQKYKTKEEIIFGLKRELKELKDFLSDIYEFFGKPKILVGTGGTPSTIAALKMGLDYASYDAKRVSGTKIEIDDIQNSYKRLLTLDPKARAQLVGIGREDAIIAGVILLEEIIKIAGFKEMIVSDEGVREGVALELCLD